MTKKWLVLVGVLLVVVVGGWLSCLHHTQTKVTSKTVKVAYLPITHALPLFEAKDLETPDGPVHIELVRYGSWPELMDALNTGKVDAAAALIELGVKAREQGIDVRALALGHTEGNVFIVGNAVNTLEDLRGKVIAIPHKQSSHKILVDELLASAHMTEEDVKVVEMNPPEMPAALATGQIAGYCVAEPFGAIALAKGFGKVYSDPDEFWHDNVCCALLVNGQFADSNPELAKAFTKAYIDGGKALSQGGEEEQIRVATKYLKFKAPIIQKSLAFIGYENLAITPERYQELTSRMVDIGLIKSVPSYSDFVASDLLPY